MASNVTPIAGKVPDHIVLQRRIDMAPEVIEKLRELADAATRLADRLEASPGDGLGLAYALVMAPYERVEDAMRRYQNDTQRP